MKGRSSLVDMTEQLKWWDILDAWSGVNDDAGFQMVRECQHPDAQWLTSLFPVGVAVTRDGIREVLLKLVDDGRAMFLAWKLRDVPSTVLTRAAELGFAPAQAQLSAQARTEPPDAFMWAEKAATQGDRSGAFRLANCLILGLGCHTNEGRAVEMFGVAAELGHGLSQYYFGEKTFGKLDWERYHWWARAAARRVQDDHFRTAVLDLLPSFENSENGRILHTVAPTIRANLCVADCTFVGHDVQEDVAVKLQRLLVLHDAMLARARNAIICWGVVGRRCGVPKDVRVMIAKSAWDEVWLWGEKEKQRTEGWGEVEDCDCVHLLASP
jgi:TPR repeat protein